RRSAETAHNVRWNGPGPAPALAPEAGGAPALAVWRIRAPYVIVGGTLQVRVRGDCSFSLSHDGSSWSPVSAASLDPFFTSSGPPRYGYWLRAELRGPGAGLDSLVITNDLQMAPLSMPALRLGENRIAYSDETRGPRRVRITHRWVESSAAQPPPPPERPLFPPDGADVDGTAPRFRWSEPRGGGSQAIVDYQFQLGERADLRWTLSPSFDRLVGRTPERGGASYQVPEAGLLQPGRRYYWRVRACNAAGVWGGWSRAWSFVPRAPGVPRRLRWERGRGASGHVLAWEADPGGRPPVRYDVHACDEQGFSVHDDAYEVNAGNQLHDGAFPGQRRVSFPPTRSFTTSVRAVDLLPRFAYYRVVAVDAAGNPSGPSDWLAAPRPFIYSLPPLRATAGAGYSYEVRTVRSIGDLRCRARRGDPYCVAFWNADAPRFTLLAGPAWLRLDPDSGELRGTPAPGARGTHRVHLRVELPGVGADVQAYDLTVVPPHGPRPARSARM
ncbi:MAG TPA: hypothetical protein VJS92_06670, partial [Candidatus Polarisedimenticolaceae bacterium]|nr:hypothetical protein [Candidatus Polarisedimenticolaceae bacterium]